MYITLMNILYVYCHVQGVLPVGLLGAWGSLNS